MSYFHVHLQLHTRRMDEENNLRVELIGFDRPDVHRVISRKAVHMFEIVKVYKHGPVIYNYTN